MAEYFAGGHLRFVNGAWRDDNGDAIEISRVRHGRWIASHDEFCSCSICKYPDDNDSRYPRILSKLRRKDGFGGMTITNQMTQWCVQEQMMDIGGMVTIFVVMGG